MALGKSLAESGFLIVESGQRAAALAQRLSHGHLQAAQRRVQPFDAAGAGQHFFSVGAGGHDFGQVVAVIEPARHIVAVALEFAAASGRAGVGLGVGDALNDDVLQIAKRNLFVRHRGGNLVEVVQRRGAERMQRGQSAQFAAFFGQQPLVEDHAAVLVQKQLAADRVAQRFDPRLELLAQHKLVGLVAKKRFLVAAMNDVELRRVLAGAAVQHGAAQVVARLALVFKRDGAAGVGQRVAEHGRQAGAAQNLLRRGAVKQRQQPQKSRFANAVVADGQHAATRVQLGNPPGRLAVFGVADVDGNDAPELMRHAWGFPCCFSAFQPGAGNADWTRILAAGRWRRQ